MANDKFYVGTFILSFIVGMLPVTICLIVKELSPYNFKTFYLYLYAYKYLKFFFIL